VENKLTMLQRIQSVWLLLAAISAFLTVKLSFFSGNMTVPGQLTHLTATSNILILILTVGMVSAIVIDIFLYKNRKLQLRIAVVVLLISLLNIFLYYKQTQKFAEGNPDLTALVALAIPVFLIFALRGIYKDERLVKSLNRLR
jgi:Domain of unknown function (DUF4293)